MNEIIYHITDKDFFESQIQNGSYFSANFETEKFTHLSTYEQVNGTLSRYYNGVNNLILLHINAKELGDKLLYEPATNGDLYPHCYGAINQKAIIKIEDIKS